MTQSLCDPFSRTFRVVSLCELDTNRHPMSHSAFSTASSPPNTRPPRSTRPHSMPQATQNAPGHPRRRATRPRAQRPPHRHAPTRHPAEPSIASPVATAAPSLTAFRLTRGRARMALIIQKTSLHRRIHVAPCHAPAWEAAPPLVAGGVAPGRGRPGLADITCRARSPFSAPAGRWVGHVGRSSKPGRHLRRKYQASFFARVGAAARG
jgi:hypothetical protein